MTTPANPDDLITWLPAQIDEDEQWAQDVLRPPARWREVQVSDAVVAGLARRQLAEVDAKRRILDRHRPHLLKAQTFRPAMLQCEHCADLCHSRSGLGCDEPIDAPWPCPDVCDLASVFAAREGFREEWRPA